MPMKLSSGAPPCPRTKGSHRSAGAIEQACVREGGRLQLDDDDVAAGRRQRRTELAKPVVGGGRSAGRREGLRCARCAVLGVSDVSETEQSDRLRRCVESGQVSCWEVRWSRGNAARKTGLRILGVAIQSAPNLVAVARPPQREQQ